MEAWLRIARGARAVEAQLFDEICATLDESATSAGALARPLRVIVPSRSLREHVAAELVRRRDRALVGVRVQTLFAAALEILERDEQAPRLADALLPVVIRQQAQAEATLRALAEPLHDGYALVADSVRDLLDAGLEPEQCDALEHGLERDGNGARARALLRVATATLESMRRRGLAFGAEVLARAAASVAARGDGALPSRRLWVHGFAEATGRASILIAELVRAHAGTVLLDHPPHPVARERDDPGVAFGRRLEQRIAALARTERNGATAEPAELELLRAPGAEAEVRAVAQRIATLLETGERPEGIAVVTRALDGYLLPLRRDFGRLGIPFSSVGWPGPPTQEQRRLDALIELLRHGDDTPVDRWLDALGFLPELGSSHIPEPARNAVRTDLSLALHALGAGRLRDVAELELETRLPGDAPMALPVRRGLAAPADDDSEFAAPFAARRRLERSVLRAAVALARRLRERLASRPETGRAELWLEHLRLLLDDDLGWDGAVGAARHTRELLDEIETAVPADFELSREEFVWLVQRELAGRARAEPGGAGGGVQLLDVTEARALCFEHLFLVGLSRDVFPRVISEDPLLPDAQRARLAALLPEIPIKAAGHDEESYLFAQLLSSSPHVVLSWQTVDDEGRARAPSSFAERQLLSDAALHVDEAAPVFGAVGDRPRPGYEHAVLLGLAGERERAEAALALSLRTESRPGLVEPRALARTRAAIRREYDAGVRRAQTLGPYFGFLGPVRERADTRRADLFVTTLESYAACPWQTLLTRFLRLEATPDALDALPTLDARMVGSTVHAALERIVASALDDPARELAQLADRAAVTVPWPAASALEALTRDAARAVLLDEGVELPGLARALAARASPYLERARELVFAQGAGVLGAEVRGALTLEDVPGTTRALAFKADLVAREGDVLTLTDYKTGRPFSTAARDDTRRKTLLARVAAGQALQGPAYQLGAGPGARGRYVFVRPDLAADHARAEVSAGDEELLGAFRKTVTTLVGGIERGVFVPRLVDADRSAEPPRCGYCDVAEACLRGDSGARRRLVQFAERARAQSDAERSALDLLGLGREATT